MHHFAMRNQPGRLALSETVVFGTGLFRRRPSLMPTQVREALKMLEKRAINSFGGKSLPYSPVVPHDVRSSRRRSGHAVVRFSQRAALSLTAVVAFAVSASISSPRAAAQAAPISHLQGVFSPVVTSRLNAAFRGYLRSHALPSVAVGVWEPGKRPFIFVAGDADLYPPASRTPGQPFRIASITKTFVAVAILQLVEAGTLHKFDTMARFYPAFPNAARITLDDLLRMRSGIAAPNDDAVLAAVYDHPTAAAPTPDQQIAEVMPLREKFVAPDTVGKYTDLNYVILGEMVRKTTGYDIGYYIKRGIIEPLRLHSTSYPTTDDLPGGLHGYGWDRARRRFDDKTLFNPALAGPAGAMISSLDDLHAFARAACRGGLVSAALHRAMLQGQPLAGTANRYGEGFLSKGGICGHSGTINGFNTDMYHFAKIDATVVISVNRLDKDNQPRTTPFLMAIFKALTQHTR